MKLLNLFILATVLCGILSDDYLPLLPNYAPPNDGLSTRNLSGTDSILSRGFRRSLLGNHSWVPQGKYFGGRNNRWGTGFGWNRGNRYE